MAKPKRDDFPPISESDVRECIDTAADFAFEMRVLKQLRALKFECQHGGTYRDSVTGKPRQFDIHADRDVRLEDFQRTRYRLHLAVECKNLRDTSPLLLHVVQRTEAEAYHDLVIRQPGTSQSDRPQVRTVKRQQSVYLPSTWVGKSTDQVARRNDGKGFQRSGSEAWDKIAQAVSSAEAVFHAAVDRGDRPGTQVVIPVLVIPDGRLWQVAYSDDGAVTEGPTLVPWAALFYGNTWEYEGQRYSVSHVEIVALGALGERVEHLSGWQGPFGMDLAFVAFFICDREGPRTISIEENQR